MRILDFSTHQFDELNLENEWEKEIQEFWNEWKSDSAFIEAKTSGSTGTPKPISLPKSAMKMSAEMTGEFFQLKKGDSALLCLPVGFIAGKMMLVRAIELGLKLYCIAPKSKINLKEFPLLDFVPMTPMQVESSLESISKIKTLLIGGAPLSDSLRSKLSPFTTNSFESYGMTETITHIALKEISEKFYRILPKIQIWTDERGCLRILTPYFPAEISTNDLVELKNEHEFKWLGRWDNVINSGGIKLIPEQIEEKLKKIISSEFIVTSIPDETLGQKLILLIEGENHPIDLSTAKLKKFEIPKEIYFLPEFPRTESGKLKRTEIKEFSQKGN